MPTNFPGSNDSFNIPSAPTTTKLKDTGDSTRSHTQNHRDLGDALMAMQAEATLLAHSHDGATFRHGNKLSQANTHQSPDTDASTSALHHTIGTGANQYASGTHTHPAVATYPIGAFFFAVVSTYPGVTDPVSMTPGLGLVGTWTAVGQRFLCASDGVLGFAAGTTGGSNTHTHTMDASTNTSSTHIHTLVQLGTGASDDGGHSHSTNGTASATRTHYHTLVTIDPGNHSVNSGDGGSGTPLRTHGHSSYNSSPSHSHSTPGSGSVGAHNHNLPSTSLGASSTHSHTNSSPQTANNLLPLFVVYMWKRTA